MPAPPHQAMPPAASLAPDDVQLLAAVRSGNPAAASAFYDRVRNQVDRTIYRLLGRGDREHADLAQVALIELVTTIGRFRGDCLLDTWVGSVTAHVVYRHLRKRQAERRLFDHLASHDDLVAVPARGGRETTARDVLECVSAHLAKLDPRQSWAYVLHDVFGYDLREVARILKVSEAAAQSRLVRGRKRLHERLAADPELAQFLMRIGGEA
jgi:RNA polymerase sigma factor (sigma-70 family)